MANGSHLWASMAWPIASLQVGLAVKYGPFCKGQKHGLSQGPGFATASLVYLPKGLYMLHITSKDSLMAGRCIGHTQGTVRFDLSNYHEAWSMSACPNHSNH